jgi:hypothetical protein
MNELLELAAKAAGIEVWFSRMSDGKGGVIEPCHRTLNGETVVWNPLDDDGDALRLAVKLNIDVFFHASRVEGHVAGGRIPPVRAIEREDYGDDPLTATRRAIVRAAAEIGRNMT